MENIEAGFRRYTESFLTGEADFDRAIQLKIDHSFRVRDEAAALAAAEAFPAERTRKLIFAALLHDYGRFEQFRQFRTFNDIESLDHGRLSAALCVRDRLLAGFAPAARGEILAAIRVHNALAVPAALRGDAALLAAAVRDADKLDIMEVLLARLGDPANTEIVWGMPKETRLTPAVAACLLSGKPAAHDLFRSATDFIAAKLAWSFDLNFDHSRREFARRNCIDRLCRFLPDTEEIALLRKVSAEKLEYRANPQYIIER